MTILTSLRKGAAPGVAVEIALGHVSAASLEWRGGQPVIAAHAAEALPDGALVPALTAVNVQDRPAVLGAIGRVLDRVGRPRRIGLIIPDIVAKASLVRGPHLIFFRNRATDTDGTLADLVHQTAMYYEDRLKGAGFARVILAGAGAADARQAGDIHQIRRSLEERLRTPVSTVDPRAAATLADRITAAPALLDGLTPLVGLLLRDRHEVTA